MNTMLLRIDFYANGLQTRANKAFDDTEHHQGTNILPYFNAFAPPSDGYIFDSNIEDCYGE